MCQNYRLLKMMKHFYENASRFLKRKYFFIALSNIDEVIFSNFVVTILIGFAFEIPQMKRFMLFRSSLRFCKVIPQCSHQNGSKDDRCHWQASTFKR